ncbi:MAG: PD-(D/E)XK nuclease family protein [Bacteroidales bacterium]
MKDTFLYKVTENLYRNHKDELADYCLVFPGKRPGLFFQRYLSELTEKPVMCPEIRTISELQQEFSGLQVADHLTLVTMLFKSYISVTGSRETLDDFFSWGETLLSDFDDVDKYLVDAQQLYNNIGDLKEIEARFEYFNDEQLKVISTFWDNIQKSRSSREKEEFLNVWDKLFDVYLLFKNELKTRNIAYEGMLYREVVDDIKKNGLPPMKYTKLVIVGFNALNQCEKNIFKKFRQEEKILFYWDYDKWYVENPRHEAGFFMRENIRLFPSEIEPGHYLQKKAEEKNFSFVSIPSDVGQAKLVHEFLPEFNPTTDPLNTAIVLCDEKLLLPVLYSLPDEIEDVNVTMGYPVAASPLFSLIDLLGELQKTAIPSKNGDRLYYHKYVRAVLNHQFCMDEMARGILDTITRHNLIYSKAVELARNDFLASIFPEQTPVSIAGYLTDVTGSLLYKLTTEAGNFDEEDEKENNAGQEPYMLLHAEILHQVHLSLKRLNDIVISLNINLSPDIMMRLIRKTLQGLSVSFTGEPLKGLQVMGVLETRVLDFENIILLSMNEGIFPKKSVPLSYIPYNLRKGFNLQTVEHQDSIFAYYFYRLLHRARNIYLVYNNNEKGLLTGEMSRFMYQLKYETAFRINYLHQAPDIFPVANKEISITKSTKIMAKLKKFTFPGGDSYLAPTSFTTYLNCPLRFYFRYVIKLEDIPEVVEDADNRIIGEVLHGILEEIYRPLTGKNIEKTMLAEIIKDEKRITSLVSSEMQKATKNRKETPVTGVNLIVKRIIENYTREILKKDIELGPFTIEGVEMKCQTAIFPEGANRPGVNTEGKIDRVDRVNGTTRIIDYKTGTSKVAFKSLEDIFQENGISSSEHVFQTFMYAWLYKNEHNNAGILTPGIYNVKEIYKDDFSPLIKDKGKKQLVHDYNSYHEEFSEHLAGLCKEIFNPEVPFYQTSDEKRCEICPYKYICHRD